MNEKRPLPKIIAVLSKEDHGPCDGGATAVCPHCGADGRYIFTFLCDDGTTRGAMAGCIKLFPRSAAADQCEKALSKQCGAKNGKSHLSKWDERILNALAQLQAGAIDARALEAIAQGVKNEKKSWMISKGYLRR